MHNVWQRGDLAEPHKQRQVPVTGRPREAPVGSTRKAPKALWGQGVSRGVDAAGPQNSSTPLALFASFSELRKKGASPLLRGWGHRPFYGAGGIAPFTGLACVRHVSRSPGARRVRRDAGKGTQGYRVCGRDQRTEAVCQAFRSPPALLRMHNEGSIPFCLAKLANLVCPAAQAHA